MAYNPQDPNMKKDEEPGGSQGSAPQLSGASGVIGPTGPSTSMAPSSQAQKTPSASGFTNVQKYIGANQKQGGALGQKIAGKIDDTIGTASNMAGSAAQGYRETVNPDQYKFDAKSFDPMKVDQKQFSNLFQGPKVGQYDDSAARQAVGRAEQDAGRIQTNAGRDQLVGEQQTLTKDLGKNTAGLRHFDRLLFQGSDQGREAIKNTGQALTDANLQGKLSSQAQVAQQVDQDAISRQRQAAEAARTAVGQQAKSLQGQIQQQTAQQKQALEANQNRIFQALSNRQDVSDSDLRSFGMNRDQYNQMNQAFDARQQHFGNQNQPLTPLVDPGVNLQSFFKKSDLSGFGAQNAVSTDQIARARALESLGLASGTEVGNLGPQTASQFSNPLGSVDFQALLNALSDKTPAQISTALGNNALANQGNWATSNLNNNAQATTSGPISGGLANNALANQNNWATSKLP